MLSGTWVFDCIRVEAPDDPILSWRRPCWGPPLSPSSSGINYRHEFRNNPFSSTTSFSSLLRGSIPSIFLKVSSGIRLWLRYCVTITNSRSGERERNGYPRLIHAVSTVREPNSKRWLWSHSCGIRLYSFHSARWPYSRRVADLDQLGCQERNCTSERWKWQRDHTNHESRSGDDSHSSLCSPWSAEWVESTTVLERTSVETMEERLKRAPNQRMTVITESNDQTFRRPLKPTYASSCATTTADGQ